MAHGLILAAALVFLAATFVYGAYLLRFQDRLHRAGAVLIGLGTALGLTALVLRLATGGFGAGPYGALLAGAVAVGAAYLALQLRKSTPVLGAFLAPVLTMMLYSLHVSEREAGMVRASEIAVVTPVHVIASILGFLVLTAAATGSGMALVQEYRLRTKRFTVAQAGRLPSLRVLEAFIHRALLIGFPIYTVGVALGAVWLTRAPSPSNRHFFMAAFSWAVYAATLHARVSLGWKGRRAAMLTLVTFTCALFVVLLSALQWDA